MVKCKYNHEYFYKVMEGCSLEKIKSEQIVEQVKTLYRSEPIFRRRCFKLYKEKAKSEKSEVGKNILNILVENAEIAKEKNIPICQDTGMAVFLLK